MTPETPPAKPSAPVYEMLWKCDYCGTDKLLGKSQRFCRNCGAPQNPKNRYFPSQEEAVAVQNYRHVGADLVCPACGGANAANCRFCTQCGAPLDTATQVALKTDSITPATPAPMKNKPSVLLPAIAALCILGIGLFALDYFWRKEVTLQLASSAWRREIKIEQFQALPQSDWCDAMPGDAYRVSSSSEVRSYRKIPDGETCSSERVDQGDGTFTTREHCVTKYRSESVYDRKCYFTVNRWRYSRSLTAGGSDRAPHDPPLELARAGNCLGCEREQQRSATYFFNLEASDGKHQAYRCEVAETLWRQAEPGSTWTLEAGALSGKTHCATLQAAH
jgi:hypothetical protein